MTPKRDITKETTYFHVTATVPVHAQLQISRKIIYRQLRSILKGSVADPDPNPDPDPRGVGPPGSGSGSTSQRYGSGSGSCFGSGSGSFYHHAKIVRKTLIPPIL